MSKRLQVVLDDAELRAIQRAARSKQMTVAEWVRQTLRAARRREPTNDARRKMEAIRAATRNSFPTADIERMLEEIESGYLSAGHR